MVSRNGLDHHLGGGKNVNLDPMFTFIEQTCIPSFFEKHNLDYEVSKCAMDVIMISINENLKILFNHIRDKSCPIKNAQSKKEICVLKIDVMIGVLQSDEFMFLRVK